MTTLETILLLMLLLLCLIGIELKGVKTELRSLREGDSAVPVKVQITENDLKFFFEWLQEKFSGNGNAKKSRKYHYKKEK